jgi:N-acyl amino acid synthase of PEP-CTERM/exosortase system
MLERRLVPMLSLGLIAAVTQMGLARGITHISAVMEPTLLRLLRRLGIHFHAAGPLVDYHGQRQPCYASGAELLEQLRAMHPACWGMMIGADARA